MPRLRSCGIHFCDGTSLALVSGRKQRRLCWPITYSALPGEANAVIPIASAVVAAIPLVTFLITTQEPVTVGLLVLLSIAVRRVIAVERVSIVVGTLRIIALATLRVAGAGIQSGLVTLIPRRLVDVVTAITAVAAIPAVLAVAVLTVAIVTAITVVTVPVVVISVPVAVIAVPVT